MAWQEIDPGELPDLPPFFKFEAIGDRFLGRFVSYSKAKGNFEKDEDRYVFKNKAGSHCIVANFDLHRRLAKAALKAGNAVEIIHTSIAPPAKEGQNGMKQFKVRVDYAPPAAPAAPKPPPPPSANDDLDDIPL